MKGRPVLVLSSFVLLSFLMYTVRIYPVEVKAVDSYPIHNLSTRLNYMTIQEAIVANETLDGHTIFVESGIYYEYVVVNKSLAVVGENRSTTVIDGNGSRRVVTITAEDVIFKGFTVRNGRSLIYLDHSQNTTVANNIASEGADGIGLNSSHSNYIIGNVMVDNGWKGPHLPYGGGLYLRFSEGNIILGNNFTDNVVYGISLGNSPNNSIIQNFIRTIYFGIEVLGSDNCAIYHNTLNNVLYEADSNNTKWNNIYPSGGNYWSQYQGRDLYSGPFQNLTGSDGIGDTPLDLKEIDPAIDPGNIDHYPLMGTSSTFQATPEHHVQTICNSTISDFRFNGTAIGFNVKGEDNTIGFCRILIPTALINDTFRVFVDGTEILPSPEPLPWSNSTHNYLYFTYNHSTQEVIVTPEFPSFLVLSLFMIATLLMVLIRKRKTTWHL